MDRIWGYPAEQPRDIDFLNLQTNAMIALGNFAQDFLFGTNDPRNTAPATRVAGFLPSYPGNMSINFGAGRVYTIGDVDATTFGAYQGAAPNTQQILQQAQVNTTTNLVFQNAPTTAGQSRIDLVQVQWQTVDGGSAPLQYWDVSTQTAYTGLGPGGNGQAQPTTRQQVVAMQVVTGTPSATPVAPTPTAGWTALYYVTVAYGQSSLSAANVSLPTNMPSIAGLQSQHHLGLPGTAPQIVLGTETQGTLPDSQVSAHTPLTNVANTFTQPQSFIGANTPIIFGTAAGQGYLRGASSGVQLAWGMDPATNTAKQASAIYFNVDSGNGFQGYFDTGLTVGNTYTPTLRWSVTTLGKITGATPTTSTASFNSPHGVAPTSPVNGDFWTTTVAPFWYINGSTWQLAATNQAQSWTATPTFGTGANLSGGTWIDFGSTPTGTPVFNTHAPSTKLIFFAQANASNVDYAFGLDGSNGRFWWSIASANAPLGWDWFAGETIVVSFNHDGSANFAGTVTVPPSTTAAPSLKLGVGVAPTTPSDGAVWQTTTGIYAQVGGATKQLDAAASFGGGLRNYVQQGQVDTSGNPNYLAFTPAVNSAPTNMTSDTAPAGYVASAGSVNSSGSPVRDAYFAFDGSASSFWNSASGVTNSWIQIQLPSAITAIALAITARSDSSNNQSPSSFTLQGSNDGTTWTTLVTVSGSTGWALGERRAWALTTTGSYTYYRLNVTAVDGGTYIGIATLELLTTSSTTALQASPSAPFLAVFANGFNGSAPVDVAGPKLTANVSAPWSSLTPGATNYVYLGLSGGAYSYGASTQQPIVSTLTPPVVNGKDWFNPNTDTWSTGSAGAWVAQTQRVYVGEYVLDGAGDVINSKSYAVAGQMASGRVSCSASTAYTVNHNLGTSAALVEVFAATVAGGALSPVAITSLDRNTVAFTTPAGAVEYVVNARRAA